MLLRDRLTFLVDSKCLVDLNSLVANSLLMSFLAAILYSLVFEYSLISSAAIALSYSKFAMTFLLYLSFLLISCFFVFASIVKLSLFLGYCSLNSYFYGPSAYSYSCLRPLFTLLALFAPDDRFLLMGDFKATCLEPDF